MSANSPDDVVTAAISSLQVTQQNPGTVDELRRSGLSVQQTSLKKTSAKVKNITELFTESASALVTGELIKDEFFTLFEAVGALEIMDPKMDSGYLDPGDTLEDDFDVLRELLPEEVIGVMDSLLCSEVAWHMGHPLSQTLLTSLYIDRLLWPERKKLGDIQFSHGSHLGSTENPMVHSILRAYCLSLIKACDFVHQRIYKETYYEEEDYVSNLYNRSLLSGIDVGDIHSIVNDASILLGSDSLLMPDACRSALQSRLNFRTALLEAVTFEPESPADDRSSFWHRCSSFLSTIASSHSYAKTVPSSFSEKVQRRLASSVPPRPIVNVDFEAAHEFFGRLCKDGTVASRVISCHRASSIITFLHVFQSRKPQPSVYMRCLLQSMLFGKTRIPQKEATERLIFEDLAELVLPAHLLLDPANAAIETPHDERFQIARRMENFIHTVRTPYYDFIRALCMNRSRTRRMLCHTVVDWDSLQLEFEDLDTELRQYTYEKPLVDGEEIWSFPLSSWTFNIKLHQMEWIVQLGFELDIYKPDEIANMYWYLQHLTNARYAHLERILNFTKQSMRNTPPPTAKEKASFEHSISVLFHNMEHSFATTALAEAMSLLYLVLNSLSLIPSAKDLPYSNDTLRHALRMRPFLPISHPSIPSSTTFDTESSSLIATLPQQQEYAKLNPSLRRTLATLDHVDTTLRTARQSWDSVAKTNAEVAQCIGCEEGWRSQIKDVLRSAISAGIVSSAVRKWVLAGGQSGKLKVEVGEGQYHAWWIVPRIVK